MGSLTSRPKAPQQSSPQVIYVPQPAYAPPPVSSVSAGGTTSPAAPKPEPTVEERESEARTKSLLTRDRGRLGTITTSFRGLLGLATGGGQGKTLLGE